MNDEQQTLQLRESESYSMSNTISMSDDIRELAMAFLLAKKNMGGAKKNSKSNRHKYANLMAVYEAVEEDLFNNNIIIWHFAERIDDNDSVLHTRLVHAPTGQFVQDTRPLKSEQPGNQAIGSANTYMRRYAVLSLCALDTEDDDGEDERNHIEKKTADLINTSQILELENLIKNDSDSKSTWSKIKSYNNIERLAQLTEEQYRNIMKYTFKK